MQHRWEQAHRNGNGTGTQTFFTIGGCLQKLYTDRLLPMEEMYGFHTCHSPQLTDADFTAKPLVLLLGQYSVGKSTFVRNLLGRDYPGMRIGPEPTTDKFVAVIEGEHDQVIPGNAAVIDRSLPFTQLSGLGNAFLSRFELSKMTSPCLEGISLIDTPGVLSGEKQRINRGYNFETVVKWFGERVDTILILFDASKLDMTDEFKRVMMTTKQHSSKVHILLNKADRCTPSQLLRVYGALMWSLSSVMQSPEVPRVYIGSFWDQPLEHDDLKELFRSEENDLYTHLSQLPRQSCVRQVDDLIKRARLVQVHAHLCDALRKALPVFGREAKQAELIANLSSVYREVSRARNIALGDFPDVRAMQEKLSRVNFRDFPKLEAKGDLMERIEHMLGVEIPKLVAAFPVAASLTKDAQILNVGKTSMFGGASNGYAGERFNPEEFRADFERLSPVKGRVSGGSLKEVMEASHLPATALHRVWTLATSATPDGREEEEDGLNLWQYGVAMKLIKLKQDAKDLPVQLPSLMLPTKADLAEIAKHQPQDLMMVGTASMS